MQSRIPGRYILIFTTFLLSLLLYIDRICISTAKTPITNDLSLTDTQMGWVLSIFAVGYALFQIPFGILADKMGPRLILTFVVTLWSLFTGLTGLATTFVFLLFVRLLFGAGEAGAFPGIARVIYTWIPMNERGIVQGINFAGSRLGAAFALPIIAWLIVTIGWRASFIFLMILGFAWAIVWFRWFRDTPEEHKKLHSNEIDYILKNRQLKNSIEKIPTIHFKKLFGSSNVWYLIVQYFCSNFTFFFCLTWLFSYIKETYSLTSLQASFCTAIPLLCGAFGNILSGWIVDYIYQLGYWTLSRRFPAIIGFALAAIGLIGCASADTIIFATIFLSIAIFGADMTLCSSWSTCIDIGKKNAGAVSGTMNMAGNIGSFITALAFPYLHAWTHSALPFFLAGALLNLLAVIMWFLIRPNLLIETN